MTDTSQDLMQQQIKINIMGVCFIIQFLLLFVSNWTLTRIDGFSMQEVEKMDLSLLTCNTVCKPPDREVNGPRISFTILM
jgi:hypothetical protein